MSLDDYSGLVWKDLIAGVADSAIESLPDWVIESCRRQTRGDHEPGQVQGLRRGRWRVGNAYLAAGREEEWLALAAIVLVPSPAAILQAGDSNESARGVGDSSGCNTATSWRGGSGVSH